MAEDRDGRPSRRGDLDLDLDRDADLDRDGDRDTDLDLDTDRLSFLCLRRLEEERRLLPDGGDAGEDGGEDGASGGKVAG